MMTRREVVRRLGTASVGAYFAVPSGKFSFVSEALAAKDDTVPPLAPGAPMSPERLSLIEAFKKQSEGLEKRYEARTLKGAWAMPYRLFKPEATGRLPLV